MRKWIVLSGFLMAFQLCAQLDVGVKAGLNYSDIRLSNLESNILTEVNNSPEVGYQIGLCSRLNVLMFYIQPELLYTQVNGNTEFTDVNLITHSESYQLHRMDIPILLGFKFGMVSVLAGPVASFNFNAAGEAYTNTYRQGSWALQAGLALHFWRMTAELKYEAALSEYATEIDYLSGEEIHRVDVDTRNNMLVLSIGYRLNN